MRNFNNTISDIVNTLDSMEQYPNFNIEQRSKRCSGRAEIATLRPERNDQSCQREIANSPGW